jgi:hypothetical protein
MTLNDLDYFRSRVATERASAEAATDPRVAAIHRELAERYEALVQPGLRLVEPGALTRAA